MVLDWEKRFQTLATPPSQTEQEKCENAVRAIRKAVSASSVLSRRSIDISTQGSYRNRTNIRIDSDVDVCLLCTDSFHFDLPEGMTRDDFNLAPATYFYRDYKKDVAAALSYYFGAESIARGNKAFDIHHNTYRVDADVVACFEHRRYHRDRSYLNGTALYTDNDGWIVNWPEQNYHNGVKKNEETGRRFKSVVRILKGLRDEMNEKGISEANRIPSYLIECLVWNVPNEGFGHSTWTADVRWAVAHLYNNTMTFENCKEWREVNELKYLFRGAKPWTREQANAFLDAAWNYVSFE